MIFNKTILIFLISFWLNNIFSQNVFTTKSYSSDFVLTSDTSYIFIDITPSFFSIGGTLYKINKYGELTDSVYIAKLKTESNHTILNSQDGYIIIGETHDDIIDDGIGFQDIIAEKIDEKGNILWQLPLKGTNMVDAINTTDGNFLILGSINEQINNATPDIVIYKINEEGNIIWQKIIGKKFTGDHSVFHRESSYFISEIDNNFYVSYRLTNNIDLYHKSYLIKVNNKGNIVWNIENNLNEIINAIFKLNNKFYFINNHKIFELNDENGNYTFTNVTNLGIFMLNYENSCNELTVIEKNDENFFFNKYNTIDSPYYSKQINSSYVSDIKKTLDGGYAFIQSNGGFIKTDCKGNYDFWDSECTNRLKPNNTLIIYPNPTTNYINIETNFKITKAIIIDPIGKELILNNYCNCNKQKIDVTKYSQGTYFLKIVGNYTSEIVKFIKY